MELPSGEKMLSREAAYCSLGCASVLWRLAANQEGVRAMTVRRFLSVGKPPPTDGDNERLKWGNPNNYFLMVVVELFREIIGFIIAI